MHNVKVKRKISESNYMIGHITKLKNLKNSKITKKMIE